MRQPEIATKGVAMTRHEDEMKSEDNQDEMMIHKDIKSRPELLDSYQYQNYIPIWIKPRIKQEWLIQPDGSYVSSLSFSTSDRKDTLSNLVIDLVFVVLVVSLSDAFRKTVDKSPGIAIRDLFALFSPIWHSWMGSHKCLNIFEENDLVYTLFFFSNLLMSAVLSINTGSCASAGDRTGCSHFVWTIAGLRLLTVFGYLYGWYFNPRYHKFLKLRVLNDVVRLLLWFTTGFFFPNPSSKCHDEDPSHKCWSVFVTFWWISWFADNLQWIPLYFSLKSNYFSGKPELLPLDTKLVVERNDMFLIISLGEIIVAALATEGNGHTKENDELYTVSNLGPITLIVILVGLMKLVLFDLNPSPSPTGNTSSTHALNRHFFNGVIWMYIYMPLNATVVIIGAIMGTLKAYNDISLNAAKVLGAAVALLVISITIIDCQHSERSNPRRVGRKHRILISVCFSILILVFPQFPILYSATHSLMVLDSIFMIYVAFIYYSHFPPKLRREEKQNILDPPNGILSAPIDGNIAWGGIISYFTGKTKYDPCEYY
jgi:low temperature requirement protein LtrA